MTRTSPDIILLGNDSIKTEPDTPLKLEPPDKNKDPAGPSLERPPVIEIDPPVDKPFPSPAIIEIPPPNSDPTLELPPLKYIDPPLNLLKL